MDLKSLFAPFNLKTEEIKPFLLKRIVLVTLLLIVIIGLDQASKHYIRHQLSPLSQYKFVFNLLTIERVQNTGAFLSLGDTLKGPVKVIILNIVPLLVMLFGLAFVLLAKSIDKANIYGIALVLGGGLGNLYDRMLYNSVTDFLFLKLGFLQTGVFNIADMAIMGGMFTILIHSYLKDRKAKQNLES